MGDIFIYFTYIFTFFCLRFYIWDIYFFRFISRSFIFTVLHYSRLWKYSNLLTILLMRNEFLVLTITNNAAIQLYILYKEIHHTYDHIELPLTYLAFPYVTYLGMELLCNRVCSSFNYIDVVFHISVAAQKIIMPFL